MKTWTLSTQILFSLFLFGSLMAQGYQVGSSVADFSLPSTEGERISLSDYQEVNGYVIVFTCNHCPYAKAYEDRLIALHEEYAPKGFPIIAINPNDPEVQPDDSFEKMKERAAEKGFPFKYLFDEHQEVYPTFGATRTPHVFLVDGEMRVRYIGAIDDNYKSADQVKIHYLRDAMDALLQGQNPDPNFTKAIGCSIKTSK